MRMYPRPITPEERAILLDLAYRPFGTAKSEYLLGRAANRKDFLAGKPFTVSVYRVRGNRRFFTDPIKPDLKSGKGVLYRVRVIPKKGRAA